MAELAKLAPLLCPDLATDDEGVRGATDHAGITETDVMGSGVFGVQDQRVGRSFPHSTKDNAIEFCRDIGTSRGSNGARLVKPKARR